MSDIVRAGQVRLYPGKGQRSVAKGQEGALPVWEQRLHTLPGGATHPANLERDAQRPDSLREAGTLGSPFRVVPPPLLSPDMSLAQSIPRCPAPSLGQNSVPRLRVRTRAPLLLRQPGSLPASLHQPLH